MCPPRPGESTGFDYDAVEAAIDDWKGQDTPPHPHPAQSATNGPPQAPDSGRTYTDAELAYALAEFARWLIYGSGISTHRRTKRTLAGPEGVTPSTANHSLARLIRSDTIASRAISAAWLLRPALFQGRSLAFIGRLPKVGMSRRKLAMYAWDFEAMFGIRNRGLRTISNRKALSASALRRWREARAKLESSARRQNAARN